MLVALTKPMIISAVIGAANRPSETPKFAPGTPKRNVRSISRGSTANTANTTSVSAMRRNAGDNPMRSSKTPTISMIVAAVSATIMKDAGANRTKYKTETAKLGSSKARPPINGVSAAWSLRTPSGRSRSSAACPNARA